MKRLELLAPAKNCELGCEAIRHGADAVYIGAPSFGARAAVGNSIEDIERLANFAHIYQAKVFATVNTLLFDNEIDAAVKILWQLYNAGVDAAIIQDMGLLECDLPPIALHASTQTHNATVERVKFLEQVGFERVILARETSLELMQRMGAETNVELEAFVQGALCVCYSGQCYMSQYLSGRSGNRGCCGQPCRSSYDLYSGEGVLLQKDRHLLSLKDFNASEHIERMIDAGITSFKIEGRLKDVDYVKNVTAYYRKLLDSIMEKRSDCQPTSSGRCTYSFVPDLERTFNRGFTDYFLERRQPMASFDTQKSLGKFIGKVTAINRKRSGQDSFVLNTKEVLSSGDGLCFMGSHGLEGFLVNHIQGNVIVPNRMPDIEVGTSLWRNHDFAFEKQLQSNTATRKIGVTVILSEVDEGLSLQLSDADGYSSSGTISCTKELAHNPERATEQIRTQLSKFGDTPFEMYCFENQCIHPYFVPASVLNELRRSVVASLVEVRQHAMKPTLEDEKRRKEALRNGGNAPYYQTTVDYRANVINHYSEQFYCHHGVETIDRGLEQTLDYANKALMTTKYCLRYELGQCLKNKNVKRDQWFLKNNQNLLRLEFDCAHCQMLIYPADSLSNK